jgi:uncharacterized membrane protein
MIGTPLDPVVALLTALAALGAAGVAGVFFAFSAFVMHGLARSGTSHGVPAMQGINLSAVRPPLMVLLFGTLLLALVAAVMTMVARGWSAPTWLCVVSFAAYGAGVVVVTATGNVPLNDRLAARTDPGTAEAAWREFAGPWQRLNHIRTATAAGSAVLLLIALRLG